MPMRPDAGRGEVLQHRHAEAAGADDEHRACAQTLLSRGADFRQRDLPREIRCRVRRRHRGMRVRMRVRVFVSCVRVSRGVAA